MSVIHKRRQFAPHLAGWLFADLLLVLFLVALVSVPPKPPTPEPVAHPPASPTPSPTPGPPRLPVLNLESINFLIVDLDVGGLRTGEAAAVADLAQKVTAQLQAQGAQDRRAGLVLAFARAPEVDTDGGIALDIAAWVIQDLREQLPLFKDIASRPLWGPGDVGDVYLEVFFFEE